MKNILFIHQSAELYGSDKTLLVLVSEFKNKGLNPIVVLPESGPLLSILKEKNIQTLVLPVLKVSRKMFTSKGIISFPMQISSSIKLLQHALKGITIDLVYSNTLAILLGYFYAQKKGLKHIWHVHEIITKPWVVKNVFLKLITSKTNSQIIYNSYATKVFWESKTSRINSVVIWNGLDKPLNTNTGQEHINLIRQTQFKAGENDIIIALVGRINRWKGQSLLLNAFGNLHLKHKNIKLVFIGSCPPNQEEYLEQLNVKVAELKLTSSVLILPFQANIWDLWQAVDIAVVPSTEPEPFGLVAIEAMLCKKPVVAANHGGLTEIVQHNETGLLFEPNNQSALETELSLLINDNEKRISFGAAGYLRAMENFTVTEYTQKIEDVCFNVLKKTTSNE